MTRTETIKVLAILKAAYPNSYKGMTKDEANGTVNVWATQFINIPASVVMIAVNKLISTNTFPPSIGEVKEKIRGLYYEAMQELPYQHGGLYANNTVEMPPQKVALLKEIIKTVEPMRTMQRIEPTLGELLDGFSGYLSGADDTKQLDGK